jgi:hypothetical protein
MSNPVTKEQYEFFRALYDEEERTALQLEGRAKVYLGVISAFLAAVLLKAGDAKEIAKALQVPWVLLISDAFPMSLALLLVLWSLRIRDFEAVNDGPALVDAYEDDWPGDAQFYRDRVADYAFASARNRRVNQETADLLAWASRAMAAGILVLLGIVAIAMWRSR